MQKIILILFVVILSTGCSVIRNGSKKNYKSGSEILPEKLFESIRKQNITLDNFFIQKAEIDIVTKNGKEKLLGSIKFRKPDKYLISIKSKIGIETARIFISNDTILVNDRINRKQYFGSTQYLEIKYGINDSVLPLIFGDYVAEILSDKIVEKCPNGKLDVDCIVGGIRIKYLIDCKRGKSILTIAEKGSNDNKIEFNYGSFIKTGDALIPRKIEIKDLQSMTTIEIRIKKIETPWDGNIEFIQGNRYELMQLL
ncbi:MAG: DUF4292 domain-containing protein [Bacteroidia bacterium]|nr:DUF4292 domain-containing protein [Bacteroidia bacterium]